MVKRSINYAVGKILIENLLPEFDDYEVFTVNRIYDYAITIPAIAVLLARKETDHAKRCSLGRYFRSSIGVIQFGHILKTTSRKERYTHSTRYYFRKATDKELAQFLHERQKDKEWQVSQREQELAEQSRRKWKALHSDEN